MKVLMISGDKRLLEEGGESQKRLALQRAQVEQLDVFVWPQVHSYREIMRAARAQKYDVITSQDPFWRGIISYWIVRRVVAKLNLQVHTDLSAYSWLKRVWAAFNLRRADSIRVVSEKLKAQVQAMGVTAPIHVLPIFVDVEKFKFLQRRPNAQKTILWIGRLEEEKDPLRSIDVLQEVRKRGVDARLVIIGSGSLQKKLNEAAANLPIETPLESRSWEPDIRNFLEVADVVLCTSKHESWGATIVESLAAGVPVVAPEVGIAQEAGAIVVPRTELASTVIRVLQSGEKGLLKLPLLNAEAWSRAWKETLV